MDEDKFDKNNINNSDLEDELYQEDNTPIDGQIGIEELYVRNNDENEEENEEILTPIENQISFEDIIKDEQKEISNFLQEQKEKQDKTPNISDRQELDDFFKTDKQIEKEQKENKEKEELNNFFEEENIEEQNNTEDDLNSVEQEDDITYKQEENENVENYENNIEENTYNEPLNVEEEFNEKTNKGFNEQLPDERNEYSEEEIRNEEKTEDVDYNEDDTEDLYNEYEGNEEMDDNNDEQSKYKYVAPKIPAKIYANNATNNKEDENNYVDEFKDTQIENEQNYNEENIVDDIEGERILDKQNDDELKKSKSSSTEEKNKVTDKKNLAEKEEYFLNEDNSQMVKEVDKINSEVGEVEIKVGKDAFGDYVSDGLETETVKDEEAKEVKEKVVSENSGEDVVDGMLYKNLDTVLHESMIPYSEHVILDRAIPRVEDGLKPVQRRILYSMIELGVTPDKPFRKSARIVGDCLGKYHPHGDSSVYDAMVRLAQPFNTNMLLIEGHGNFGSVDGDGAAAMRYTEARLAPLALELLRDLDKNTVRWGLNFDDTLKEPEILPGRFPNLLVNGSTGIAVGLATNIPPHNLAEAIDGVMAYIDNPNITLKEMMRIIKGPDFPTGGYILNSSEIKEAYETGRGKIYIRAKMHIETNNNDKKYIVITELPYQVNKSSLLQKINSFKEEDKYGLGVISEVRDESDRDGLRAVIRLKKDANVKKVYEALIKYTELQVTFGVNMVAIANGKPKQMGLLDIISYYTEYQREIILRRSKYECEQAKEREHILSGLLIAIKNIDAVVKIIKTSKNTTEAKARLREKFYLSEKQAQAILDMRLARLTSLEVFKLEEEIKKLRELIKRLTEIINSKKEQLKVVKEEIAQIKREHKRERKTKILRTDDTLNISEQNEPEREAVAQNVVILKNAKNNFKCLTQKQYNQASKEFTDSSSLFEAHNLKFEVESNKSILAFSSLGNCFKVTVKDFGESRYKDKGINERMIFKELAGNETIVALVNYDDTATKENLLFLTKFGMIKKTPLTEYALLKKYFQAMKLKDGDEILTIVKEPKESYNFVFVSKLGMVLKAENKDVPVQGRVSGGVKGMAFSGDDCCVCAQVSNDEGEVIIITDKGNSKRVVLTNIDKMVRYRKGLKIMALAGETGKQVVYSSVVKQPYTVVVVGDNEELYSKSTELIPIETRIGKGKILDKTKKNMQIKQIVIAL